MLKEIRYNKPFSVAYRNIFFCVPTENMEVGLEIDERTSNELLISLHDKYV